MADEKEKARAQRLQWPAAESVRPGGAHQRVAAEGHRTRRGPGEHRASQPGGEHRAPNRRTSQHLGDVAGVSTHQVEEAATRSLVHHGILHCVGPLQDRKLDKLEPQSAKPPRRVRDSLLGSLACCSRGNHECRSSRCSSDQALVLLLVARLELVTADER